MGLFKARRDSFGRNSMRFVQGRPYNFSTIVDPKTKKVIPEIKHFQPMDDDAQRMCAPFKKELAAMWGEEVKPHVPVVDVLGKEPVIPNLENPGIGLVPPMAPDAPGNIQDAGTTAGL